MCNYQNYQNVGWVDVGGLNKHKQCWKAKRILRLGWMYKFAQFLIYALCEHNIRIYYYQNYQNVGWVDVGGLNKCRQFRNAK
jgi:hypothetical protein